MEVLIMAKEDENIKANFFHPDGGDYTVDASKWESAKRIKEFRIEVSKKISMANKRVQRMEGNQLQDSPAYKKYMEGGGKFSIKGKTYNEVQAELARVNRFINSNTTIRGINNTLKEMAENTGIKYNSLKELRKKSAKFFELASKVEQYLRTVEDMASAIGYQQIWEVINVYTTTAKVDLADSEAKIDSMLEEVTKAIMAYENPYQERINEIDMSFEWHLLK